VSATSSLPGCKNCFQSGSGTAKILPWWLGEDPRFLSTLKEIAAHPWHIIGFLFVIRSNCPLRSLYMLCVISLRVQWIQIQYCLWLTPSRFSLSLCVAGVCLSKSKNLSFIWTLHSTIISHLLYIMVGLVISIHFLYVVSVYSNYNYRQSYASMMIFGF